MILFAKIPFPWNHAGAAFHFPDEQYCGEYASSLLYAILRSGSWADMQVDVVEYLHTDVLTEIDREYWQSSKFCLLD